MTGLTQAFIYSACLYPWHRQPGQTQQVDRFGGQDGEGADALLQRFQILLFPDARGPRKFVDEPLIPLLRKPMVYLKITDLKWQSLCSLEKAFQSTDRRLVLLLFSL